MATALDWCGCVQAAPDTRSFVYPYVHFTFYQISISLPKKKNYRLLVYILYLGIHVHKLHLYLFYMAINGIVKRRPCHTTIVSLNGREDYVQIYCVRLEDTIAEK